MGTARRISTAFGLAAALLGNGPSTFAGGLSDPFTALPWSPTGTLAAPGFGEIVATAGDVNADGYGDVVATDPLATDGIGGAVRVYFGSKQGSSPTPNWSFFPGQVDAGAIGDCAGDVNGDGFMDLLVASTSWDTPADSNAGKVSVFHGGPNGLPLTPSTELFSPIPADDQYFGFKIATAGDTNGDGFADVLIGAPFLRQGGFARGAVFVFHGSAAGLAATPAKTIFGAMSQNSQFGISISTAGDVNGDGFADAILGAPAQFTPFTRGGAAYLYLGSNLGLFDDPDTTILGTGNNHTLGQSVSLAGDANGDGFGDVLIGIPGFNNGEGRAVLVFGGANGLASQVVLPNPELPPNGGFGRYVATLGDLEGDGLADFGVGSFNPPAFNGRISVYRSHREELDYVGEVLSRGSDGFFGSTFGTSGDTDGDGRSEILVGTEDMSVTPSGLKGRAFQFKGPRFRPRLAIGWPRAGAQAGTGYGTAVAIVPRFASAFPPRLVIGDPGFNGCGRISAHNYKASGGVEFNELTSVTSTIPMQGLGSRLVDAGDMNGDGFSDFASSSTTFENGGLPEAGRVDFHAGAALGPPPPAPSPVVFGTHILDHVGSALAGRGDVNGDGFHDLLVGAPQWDEPGSTDCGKAFLFFGSASGPVTGSPWTVVGAASGQGLGASVALTDLDADGYTDVVIGSSSPTPDSNLSGKVEAHYGGPSGPSNTVGLQLDPHTPSVSFGKTVAAIGDVTADHVADLAVGAPTEDGRGVVRLYAGTLGRSQSQVPLARLVGIQDDERYGEAIAGGGDMDGDGVGDFAIGAPLWDGSSNDEGRVTLHFGAPIVPEIPATYEFNTGFPEAHFGSSIAPFRDLNADGFADMVVGAPGSDRVYPFFGDEAFGALAHLQPYEPGPFFRFHPARYASGSRIDLGFQVQNAGAGRIRTKFEVEVVPENEPFTGAVTTRGTNVDSKMVTFVGPTINLAPTLPGRGLKARGHWITTSPYFPRSRWITPEAHTSGDHDVWLAGTVVGVPSPGPGTAELRIDAVSPNPSVGRNGASRVAFTMPRDGHVTLEVFDLRGARVLRLLDEMRAAGRSAVAWDGRDDDGRAMPAGVYFVVLRAGDAVARAKVVRLP